MVDVVDPVVSVLDPVNWSSVASPVTVSGLASDDVGVDGVQVRVYDRDSSSWWDGGGWVSGSAIYLSGDVVSPGATSSGWSYDFVLGSVPASVKAYLVSVRSFDAAGNSSPWSYTNFYVGDVVDPVVSVLDPVNWSSVASPVTVSGLASDDVGVDGVQVRVYDRDSSSWWDGGGWVSGSAIYLSGDVVSPGATSSGWSYDFVLGSVPASVEAYLVSVRSFDAAGNSSPWSYTNFYVGDVVDPVVSVLDPVNWSSVASPVTVSGSASDDVGVDGVQVRVYDRDSSSWWDGGGWVSGSAIYLSGDVVSPGATSSGWSYDFVLGSVPASVKAYLVSVRSFDAAGNSSPWSYTNFYVGDVVDPVVSVLDPVNWSSVASPVTVSGLASDDVGVDGVQVRVYDRDSSSWWDGGGWVSGSAIYLSGDVVSPGATSSGWSYDFVLGSVPASVKAYLVSVRSFDAAGNSSPWSYTNFYVGDVVDPVVSVLDPVNWSSVASPVTVSGLASDDVGVDGVQVRVYDRDSSSWWDGGGWVSGSAIYLSGDVVSPGATSSGWSYDFVLGSVPASVKAYLVSVRSFDAAGNSSPWSYTNFYVGDVVDPVVSVLDPVNWSSVASPVTVSGSASDDVGVDGVQVRVYDRDSSSWWDGGGWVSGSAIYLSGDVVSPGATSSGWSYDFVLGSVPASVKAYLVSVRSFDAAGNSSPWSYTNFYVGS